MAGLYEIRATNHEQRITNNESRLFSWTQMRLRRDRLMIVLRPCATCHEFRLCTGFTRSFWPVRCRPAEGARRLPKRTAEAGRLGQDVPCDGPEWGLFSRAEGQSRRCSRFEFVAAYILGDIHRIHAGRPLGVSYGGERRPANSGAVRPQNSMNDERPTMNGLSPAVRPLNCVNDTILCQNETNDRQYSISKYT